MVTLKDNLKRWREAAEIDWFSQFIKAWIPFNAWMTNAYGDLKDRELLDSVKAGSNVVYNRIVPMLTKGLPSARDTGGGWQDSSPEANEFRLQIAELYRLLQSCVVDGRRGRVSFEMVDVGANLHKDEQRTKRNRNFRVRPDHPAKPQIALEISAIKTYAAFNLILPTWDRRQLEDDQSFRVLHAEQRTMLLAMFDAIAPRRIINVLAQPGATDVLKCGETAFIDDSSKLFSALIDVIYSLRNALFHGSITPNDNHNEIYEPAYRIVMRLVKSTL